MTSTHDYIVIGAGPAGLQLGYFFENQGRDYVILERNETVGSFFTRYPRSRGLISFNKVHSVYDDPEINLRWDWNSLLTDDYSLPFKAYSKQIYPAADDMVRYLQGFYEATQPHIRFGTDVTHVSKQQDGRFVVSAADGTTWYSRLHRCFVQRFD